MIIRWIIKPLDGRKCKELKQFYTCRVLVHWERLRDKTSSFLDGFLSFVCSRCAACLCFPCLPLTWQPVTVNARETNRRNVWCVKEWEEQGECEKGKDMDWTEKDFLISYHGSKDVCWILIEPNSTLTQQDARKGSDSRCHVSVSPPFVLSHWVAVWQGDMCTFSIKLLHLTVHQKK